MDDAIIETRDVEKSPIEQETAHESTGLSAEEFSALAERFSTVAPLLRGLLGSTKEEREVTTVAEAEKEKESVPAGAFSIGRDGKKPFLGHRKCAPREALLLALCPYLSPERREMAEYLVRISRIYDTVRELL